MESPTAGAGTPHLRDVPQRVPLAGPDPRRARPAAGPDAVTGGGLAAIVHPARGVRSLWRGRAPVAGRLEVRADGRRLPEAGSATLDGAGWERRLRLPSGALLIERGVLVDSAPAALLSWHLARGEAVGAAPTEALPPGPPPRLEVELLSAAGDGGRTLSLQVGPDRTAGAAILPGDADPDRLAPRLRPPHARERARREGRIPADHPVPAILLPDGVDPLAPALRALDRAPLEAAKEADPSTGSYLLGVRGAAPRYASGAPLVEMGLGFLVTGRFGDALATLAALAAEPEPPALPFLHLAGAVAAWTGEPARLLPFRSVLARAAERMSPTAGSGAAFPGPVRVLDALAAGIEPLGGDWKAEVEARRDRLLAGAAPGAGAEGPGRSLPVLGGGAPPGPAPPRGLAAPPKLPPPGAFAPVDAPALLDRRSLHAARIARSWLEGTLGIEPDGAYGRLRLAPDLVGRPDLAGAHGIRVGDATLRFDCRAEGGARSFHLVQEGGRVPLNVVFEPRLPVEPPLIVTIGGDEAEVGIEPVDGGIALSCQFPLDPERRIVVEQRG